MTETLAALEHELAELRAQIEAADRDAAEQRRTGRRVVRPGSPGDLMPLRDRLQVVERKIARLQERPR